ncbi:MAG: pantoate--beta-alanine ligase [Candidatus Saccharibacteria bacterium]
MIVIEKPGEMQEWSRARRLEGKKIGVVPTMGYLHEGHLSLVKQAKELCDCLVVTIFVNPTQFGVGEDFESYPRDLTRDLELVQREGVDVVFAPAVQDMYPVGYGTFVETSGLDDKLCGKSRPGHFRGVTTVVSKLFNICLPDVAVFGQKDAQQVMIIEKMVRDLNFPVRIIRGATVREEDGLAKSSRNTYLTPEQRQTATILYKSLLLAQKMINEGNHDPVNVKGAMIELLSQEPAVKIDYVEILDGRDLSEIVEIQDLVLIALAAKVGSTRLIDNLLVEV